MARPGSSPLPRGQEAGYGALARGRGFIPAPAGASGVDRDLERHARVHPRSRGGKVWKTILSNIFWGSSPLPRGQGLRRWRRRHDAGFIPAPAGARYTAPPLRAGFEVHPRSRGGKARASIKDIDRSGSSPLPRGQAGCATGRPGSPRFIPAPAGARSRPSCRSASTWVHPRSRGGKIAVADPKHFLQGSSPLPRGQEAAAAARLRVLGFIPAPAGARSTPTGTRTAWWVHPRSRGGKASAHKAPCMYQGSSPLPRGQEERLHPCLGRLGFIPAPAGARGSLGRTSGPSWVHPRSRGGKCQIRMKSNFQHGSSPLPRGQGCRGGGARLAAGFIPAPAGASRPSRSRPP